MSSCLVFQEKNKLYIGADSILSTLENNEIITSTIEAQKLFCFGNTIMFCAGDIESVKKTVKWCRSVFFQSEINIDLLSEFLNHEFPSKTKFFNVEIIIALYENNQPMVYQLSQYENFYPKLYTVSEGINIITAGIQCQNVFDYAYSSLISHIPVKKIFLTLYDGNKFDNIGGHATLYELSSNGINELLHPNIIDSISIDETYFFICADLLVGRTVLSENLQVVNDANNFTIDKNGLLAKATNNFSVSINPNNPSAIFTIKNGSNTVLGVDAATNKFVFKGTLESTDGKIGGFTIGATTLVAGTIGLASSGNIQMWAGNADAANAPFKVYSDGSIYTNKIQITGGSFALGNNFLVDSAGNMKCSNADISGKITALVGGKIGAFTITQNGLRADNERVDIEWGDFYVSGHEATIGSVTMNNDGIDVGILSGNGRGGTFDSDGIIHSTEIYIGDPWWDGQSITQRVEELYNYVYYGGWCRGGDDCDDSCDNCDGGGCDGGGCKDEEHLADDIGAGC